VLIKTLFKHEILYVQFENLCGREHGPNGMKDETTGRS
jgi:hypothetical protein